MKTALIAVVLVLALVPTAAAGEPLPDTAPKDVYIPAYEQCLWKGSWKVVVDTPVARVWHYSCDSPDT